MARARLKRIPGIHASPRLSLRDSIELEKQQKRYQSLCRDFSAEVIDLLGGVEGDKALLRQARQELAIKVANCVAEFILTHTKGPQG